MARVFSAVVIALCGLQCSSAFIVSHAQSRPAAAAVDLAALDRKADPCVDFYTFACGGWMANHALSPDRRAFGRFTELQERNFEILRRTLESPPDAAGDVRKASEFYAACMNEAAIEQKALTPVEPELKMLGDMRNPNDLPVIVARRHEIGVPVRFHFSAQTDLRDATQQIAEADRSGLALPDRDYYLKDDKRSRNLRAQYVAHIEQTLELAGAAADEASADATAIVAIETTLARASMDRVRRREPPATQHRTTLVEFQTWMPTFDWRKYATAAEAPKFQVLNVTVPDYFRALNALLEEKTFDELKAYLRWHRGARSARRRAERGDGPPRARRPRPGGRGPRSGDRWFHPGTARIPWLATDLVRDRDARGGTVEGTNDPARVESISRQPSGGQHVRIREGLSCKANAPMVRPTPCRVW